jgi:hypothetical protein
MSDDKIVSLSRKRAPVNTDLVRRLKEWLALAETGALQAAALAGAARDHSRMTGWCDIPTGYHHDVASAIMELHWRHGESLYNAVETPTVSE